MENFFFAFASCQKKRCSEDTELGFIVFWKDYLTVVRLCSGLYGNSLYNNFLTYLLASFEIVVRWNP